MFKPMFLCPYQKNEYLKIDLIKVAILVILEVRREKKEKE